ncbi:ParB/RepB/Spo0J family partition protein [Robertmurraya sp. DFI.2.37]|uniref:ParB/RepB/Spo0J family partition protein n=1 Tax=Robertmurraya sp. DFI.2.37 TaxID=3031819 RepID=UPI0023DB90E6|nr:ParB/RepB/Spo0J family partition protein [Robertmurraya sp. DFI.2.37]MDF1511152.1 ParB/RepB/Spo0J family partition protein [Robertmurraya sp. DFI.2.37]
MVEQNVIKGGGASQVIEVATSQLTEHSIQSELSPNMNEKAWLVFKAGIATNGILQPIVATRGFRVIDGKHRLRAAKELGIESVRVVFEDIPEDDIATYITETKLGRDDLKKGQKAAILINLYYEDERKKAEERMRLGKAIDPTEKIQGGSEGEVAEIIARKVGISSRNVYFLLAVKRNRQDLYAKVFDGSYSIGKAHAEMKRDEQPQEQPQENPIESERKRIKELAEHESSLPQIDESRPAHELNNRLVQMRKKALSLTVEVLDESEKMNEAKPEVKESARSQLLTLTRSCVLALGQTADSDDDAEVLAVINELLNKLSGGN